MSSASSELFAGEAAEEVRRDGGASEGFHVRNLSWRYCVSQSLLYGRKKTASSCRRVSVESWDKRGRVIECISIAV